jgi:hypothetical protein
LNDLNSFIDGLGESRGHEKKSWRPVNFVCMSLTKEECVAFYFPSLSTSFKIDDDEARRELFVGDSSLSPKRK